MLHRLHSGPDFPNETDVLAFFPGIEVQIAAVQVARPDWLQTHLAQFALIDREAAGMNEPMLDLSNIMFWFAAQPQQELAFLHCSSGGQLNGPGSVAFVRASTRTSWPKRPSNTS